MDLQFLRPRSLKTRIVVLTLLVLVIGLWGLAYFVSHMLRADLLALVGRQQLSTVSIVSARIADEVEMRMAALNEMSAQLGAAASTTSSMPAPLEVQMLLARYPLAPKLFSGGTFFADAEGMVRAVSPTANQHDGQSYRIQLAAVLGNGQELGGAPVAGKTSLPPKLLMAVPVRDRAGQVVGALAGIIDLAQPGFLDLITRHRYGETGDLFLVSPRQRLIITGSQVGRIMETLPPPGANAVIDRVLAGYQGTVRMTNPQGIEVLNSGRHVARADWDVVASLPLDEALAPAQQLLRRILGAAALLTLVLGTLTWWLLRRQLAPAVAAAELLALQAREAGEPRPLPVGLADEVGTLIDAFNRTISVLAKRDEQLRLNDQVLQSISEAVVITGPDHAVVWANLAHDTVTGYMHGELVGRNLRLLQGPLTAPATVALIRQALSARGRFSGEILNYRKDGSTFWNDLLISPLHDAQGRLTHFVGLTRDVTRRKEMEQQVHRLAFNDPLTQLPNRRLLNDRLEQVLSASKRHGLHGAVLFVDIDGLKPLNDIHGHAMGDLLLIQVAQRLLSSVREIDTVARYGGDEFVVVLAELSADEQTSTERAGSVAEKIRDLLATPYTLGLTDGGGAVTRILEYRCSASIGVCVFRGQHPQALREELLRRADAAMYRAKQAGRNTVVFDETRG